MSILAHTHASAPRNRIVAPAPGAGIEKSSTPFPSSGDADPDGCHGWGMQPEVDAETRRAQRTVRRKKSSFDLRDVFKNGGALPVVRAVSML